MSVVLDSQRLGLIFESRPDIIEGIKRASGELPSLSLIALPPIGILTFCAQTRRDGSPCSTRLRITCMKMYSAMANQLLRDERSNRRKPIRPPADANSHYRQLAMLRTSPSSCRSRRYRYLYLRGKNSSCASARVSYMPRSRGQRPLFRKLCTHGKT